MKYWIISDPHFGHDALVKGGYRPEGHEKLILQNIYDLVQDTDILICLGDVAFYKKEYWHKRLMQLGPYNKILVKGNHDRETTSWYYKQGWDFVCDSFDLNIYGKEIHFSHYPIPIGRLSENLNIHGHLHDNPDRIETYRGMRSGVFKRHYLVKMEHNYKPVELKKLVGM